MLRQFEDRCAQYRVHWEELPDKEADSRVNSGEADLGLCIYQEQARNVDFTPLIRKRMMLLVYEGHRLWDRDAVEFRDLEGEAIIIEGSDFHIYPQFQQLCLEEGFYPHIIARTAEISFCQHLCRIRAGVSVTVDFITEQSNLEGLRAIPFADGRFSWTVGIGKSLGGTLSPGARELEAFLLENCR